MKDVERLQAIVDRAGLSKTERELEEDLEAIDSVLGRLAKLEAAARNVAIDWELDHEGMVDYDLIEALRTAIGDEERGETT
jgi:hypothetical protein